MAAGYKVGVYSSPHLVRYTERVRVQGEELAVEVRDLEPVKIGDDETANPGTQQRHQGRAKDDELLHACFSHPRSCCFQ